MAGGVKVLGRKVCIDHMEGGIELRSHQPIREESREPLKQTEEDPAKHSDFDNWVRVKNVPAAQHALKGTCPVVYQGKVISGSDQQHLEGSHHLGIHLFPESPDYIVRFIR